MITSSTAPVQDMRLNGFVHLYIQRDGIAYVIENYCPIREQYYAQKYNNQNTNWEGNPDVQSLTRMD